MLCHSYPDRRVQQKVSVKSGSCVGLTLCALKLLHSCIIMPDLAMGWRPDFERSLLRHTVAMELLTKR